MGKYCAYCGHELNEKAQFCGNCGANSNGATLNENESIQENVDNFQSESVNITKKKISKKTLMLVGIAVIIVVIVIIALLSGLGNSSQSKISYSDLENGNFDKSNPIRIEGSVVLDHDGLDAFFKSVRSEQPGWDNRDSSGNWFGFWLMVGTENVSDFSNVDVDNADYDSGVVDVIHVYFDEDKYGAGPASGENIVISATVDDSTFDYYGFGDEYRSDPREMISVTATEITREGNGSSEAENSQIDDDVENIYSEDTEPQTQEKTLLNAENVLSLFEMTGSSIEDQYGLTEEDSYEGLTRMSINDSPYSVIFVSSNNYLTSNCVGMTGILSSFYDVDTVVSVDEFVDIFLPAEIDYDYDYDENVNCWDLHWEQNNLDYYLPFDTTNVATADTGLTIFENKYSRG
jgi:hypothetical protein